MRKEIRKIDKEIKESFVRVQNEKENKRKRPFTFLRDNDLSVYPYVIIRSLDAVSSCYSFKQMQKNPLFRISSKNCYQSLSVSLKQLFIDINDSFLEIKNCKDFPNEQFCRNNFNEGLESIKEMFAYVKFVFDSTCSYLKLKNNIPDYDVPFNPFNNQYYSKKSEDVYGLSNYEHKFVRNFDNIPETVDYLKKIIKNDLLRLNAFWKDDRRQNFTRFSKTLYEIVDCATANLDKKTTQIEDQEKTI